MQNLLAVSDGFLRRHKAPAKDRSAAKLMTLAILTQHHKRQWNRVRGTAIWVQGQPACILPISGDTRVIESNLFGNPGWLNRVPVCSCDDQMLLGRINICVYKSAG